MHGTAVPGMVLGTPPLTQCDLALCCRSLNPCFRRAFSRGGFIAEMVRLFVAIVRGDRLEGGFARVEGVDLSEDVEAFIERLKSWSPDLASVHARYMTVYGPWASADGVPDVNEAMRGRGRDPATVLSTLIGTGMERAYFLVRITTPIAPPAAAGGAGASN